VPLESQNKNYWIGEVDMKVGTLRPPVVGLFFMQVKALIQFRECTIFKGRTPPSKRISSFDFDFIVLLYFCLCFGSI